MVTEDKWLAEIYHRAKRMLTKYYSLGINFSYLVAKLISKNNKFNFSCLTVSVRQPCQTCAFFFCVNVWHWTFFQRHFSHDSPVDVVFSRFPRGSVPLCLPFVCENVCVCVYVCVCVKMCTCVCVWFVYVCVECVCLYMCMCVCVFVSMCVCVCSVCVVCVFGKMVNAP